MRDPDSPTSDSALFVDRAGEAEALRAALREQRTRLNLGLVDEQELRNVLTFWGDSGVGKTELSRRLARWIAGDDTDTQHWGKPPSTKVDAVARWDLNDSRGALDPIALLAALRFQLGNVQREWAAFDFAFGALHRVIRPGIELSLRSPRTGATTLSEILGGLTEDALAAKDIAVSAGAAGALFNVGRSLLTMAHERSKARSALTKHSSLERLVLDCEAASGSVDEIARLAGRIAFLLSEEIDYLSPPDRPLIVVFVDHVERVQVPGERHLGEATLNRLVSRLPHLLFVITGRNSLGWYEHSSDLPASGPRSWPLLSTDDPPTVEPKQHRLGHLAPQHAEQLLVTAFATYGVRVAPGVIANLVETTGGWPLHLQTIVGVARERSTLNRPLTLEDLGGKLPTLVERLLSDMPADVAQAFRAACLLPFFDIDFVVAAGEVRAGAVEHLLDREVVRANPDSPYPYRVHDTLRALVQSAGASLPGGWGAADWERHARLALAEASRRFEEALARQDDLAAVGSLALGLNVATEHSLFDTWLVEAIRRSPTVQGLATLVASKPEAGAPLDLVDTLEFLRLRAAAREVDVTDALKEIVARRTAIASSAGLWRAYDLRSRGRPHDAVQQLEELILHFDDRPHLYRTQIVTTLRLSRQFRSALERGRVLNDAQQEWHRGAIDRAHGRYDGAGRSFEDRVRREHGRRFQVELLGDLMVVLHRESGVEEREVLAVHATAVGVGHAAAQASCAGVLAEMHLFDDKRFAEYIDELQDLSARNFQPYRSLPTALAMRALAIEIEKDELAARAQAITLGTTFRSSAWIPTEILLDYLGHPVDMGNVQWVDDTYAEVRDRWLRIFDRIVDRARRRLG